MAITDRPGGDATDSQWQTIYENPFDFALVATRDPELLTVDSLLLGGPAGAATKVPGVTDAPNPQSSRYSLAMYTRSGMYGSLDTIQSASGTASTLPHGLFYYTRNPPWGGAGLNRTGGTGGASGLVDEHLVLRMWPVPDAGPQTSLQGELQTGATIFAGRPHGIGRTAPTQTLSLGPWRVDTVLSAPPVLLPGGEVAAPDWLEGYVALWEALATPHPLLGRKPALTVKFGSRWWGLGRMVCFLESVEVNREYYERGTLASATLSLRFSEVLR